MFNPLNHEFWSEILVAILCGAILGIERELHGKPAGLRTCVLIVLGTALFVRLGLLIESDNADPTRVLGQVVTGIGFLGAGVMFSRGYTVKGVTTAAVIWMLAAIGAMTGAGYYGAAIAVTLVALVVLVGLNYVSRWLDRFADPSQSDSPDDEPD
ncbi:MAG: MgtC/SapB family protein [Planctomycetaceae bacterium]